MYALRALAVSVVLSNSAWANPSLRESAVVETGLFEIAVADRIRKQCTSISARLFRANGKGA